jgi:hypothetical protein
VTHGFLMVADLQGALMRDVRESRDGIFLTDPVLLCNDILRFGGAESINY